MIDGTSLSYSHYRLPVTPWDILSISAVTLNLLCLSQCAGLARDRLRMNNGSVITANQNKLPFMRPGLSTILDSLPFKQDRLRCHQKPSQMASLILVHIRTEQYLTPPVQGMNFLGSPVAEGLLQTLVELGPKVLAAPEN